MDMRETSRRYTHVDHFRPSGQVLRYSGLPWYRENGMIIVSKWIYSLCYELAHINIFIIIFILYNYRPKIRWEGSTHYHIPNTPNLIKSEVNFTHINIFIISSKYT